MHTDGHEVFVAGQHGAWAWLFERAPFRWIDLPLKGGPLSMFRMPRVLGELSKELKIDLIHSHYRKPTWAARHIALSLRPPVLYTLHLSHIDLRFPRNLLTDFGDHTHVPSADAKQWMINTAGVAEDRITLIPHGIDVSKFPLADDATPRAAKRAMGFDESHRVAVYVGRLDVPKNADWLLDLAEAMPDLRIAIAGEGPHESLLRARIDRNELAHRVKLLGHREPLPVYQAADALLLPSSREGFSYVCAEAMSVGVPVLRTHTSGTKELIVEDQTGRSCEIQREAFVQAAIQFLSPSTELARMGIAAAEHVRKNLTFQRQYDQTIALYRRLINQRTAAR